MKKKRDERRREKRAEAKERQFGVLHVAILVVRFVN